MENNECYSYGRYLDNHPIGEDFYEGKSQEKLAEAIGKHIKEKDQFKGDIEPKVSRLIGLDGEWGSGKSNVVELLKKNLKEKYHFFTFDAWGHQEDLQRRSLLENLISDLVDNKLLVGKTDLKMAVGDDIVNEKVEWKDRLYYLLSRKSRTKHIEMPIVAKEFKILTLTALWCSLSLAFFQIERWSLSCWDILCISLGPLVLYSLGITLFNCETWTTIWHFYKTDKAGNTVSYSFAGLEPSERELRNELNLINNTLQEGKKRIVIVFDNMDRLPKEKIKQLWSTINTFFAINQFSHIWVIIPFDRNRLKVAYCEDDGRLTENNGNEEQTLSNRADELSKKFIEKTFPVVFRVPQPIITDYRKVFDKLMEDTFVKTRIKGALDKIGIAYRHKNPVPNMREMIYFINKMVMYNAQWHADIAMENIAIYVLNEDEIGNNGDEAIVGTGYLKGLDLIFDDNSERKAEIAALHYDVNKDIARQIPVKNLLRKAFAKGEYSDTIVNDKSAEFDDILDEMINEMDYQSQLLNAIKFVNKLNSKNYAAQWDKLAKYFILHEALKCENCNKEAALLIEHSSYDIAKSVMNTFGRRMEEEIIDIEGENIYTWWRLIVEKAKAKDIEPRILNATIEAETFINFIRKANNNFEGFNINTPNYKLCDYLKIKITNVNNVADLNLVKQIDEYDISRVSEALKNAIVDCTVQTLSYEDIYFKQLKVIENGVIKFDNVQSWNNLNLIKNAMQPNKNNFSSYFDIYSLLILNRVITIINRIQDLNGIENYLFRYVTFADLWNLAVNKTASNAQKVLINYLIQGTKKCDGKITNEQIVTIESVRAFVGVNINDMLDFIKVQDNNICFDSMDQRPSDIFVSPDWLKFAIDKNISFADDMLQWHKMKIEEENVSSFYTNHRLNNSGYWPSVLGLMIKKDAYKEELSDKLVQLCKEPLKRMRAYPNESIDDEVSKYLLAHAKFDKVSTEFNDTYNFLCSANNRWNIDKFKNLHVLIEQADIRSINHNFLNYCLLALFDNTDAQKIILANTSFYREVIVANIKGASGLKDKINGIANKYAKDNNDSFAEWCASIYEEIKK